MTANLRINAKRIRKDLEDLARIGRTIEGGVHRPAFQDQVFGDGERRLDRRGGLPRFGSRGRGR